MTGWGIRRRIFKIFCEVVRDYHEGDEIFIIGYSRGAFMAITLANLLNCVGIPRTSTTENFLKECFDSFCTNKLYDPEQRQELKKQSNSLEVPIRFLGCLDTVRSLGVPKTGILRPLKYTPKLVKHLQSHSTDVPDNVRVFRQYLALDEYRAIFEPMLMHVDAAGQQDCIQEWFAGSHSDLGRVARDGTGLGNVVLRCLVGQLQSATVNITFNTSALAQHFRKYTTSTSAELDIQNSKEWIFAKPRNTWTPFWIGGGLKMRVPGWYKYSRPGKKTNEVIHPSLYPREQAKAGRNAYPSLQGHFREMAPEGHFVWKKKGSWSSTGSWSSNSSRATQDSDMNIIPEGAHNSLEQSLGGYDLQNPLWEIDFRQLLNSRYDDVLV